MIKRPKLEPNLLESICKTIADTNDGLTGCSNLQKNDCKENIGSSLLTFRAHTAAATFL